LIQYNNVFKGNGIIKIKSYSISLWATNEFYFLFAIDELSRNLGKQNSFKVKKSSWILIFKTKIKLKTIFFWISDQSTTFHTWKMFMFQTVLLVVVIGTIIYRGTFFIFSGSIFLWPFRYMVLIKAISHFQDKHFGFFVVLFVWSVCGGFLFVLYVCVFLYIWVPDCLSELTFPHLL